MPLTGPAVRSPRTSPIRNQLQADRPWHRTACLMPSQLSRPAGLEDAHMDNLVAGRIFIDGSTQGVPDLLVTLYDLDPAVAKELAQKGRSNDDPIDGLFSQAALRFWLDFPGDRIGSVLTDRQGRFELHFDDAEFRVRNAEKRPDLVLFVMGPDRHLASHPAERLLHYAMVPRVNAGRQEHFVIAIDRTRLSDKGVVLDQAPQDPEVHVAEQRQQISRKGELRSQMSTLYREQIALGNTRRTQARNFWLNLGLRLLPAESTASAAYVPRGTPLAVPQQAAITRGIEALRNARPGSGIRLWLTPPELTGHGLDADELEAGGSINVSVCDLLARKGLGTELVRIRGLMDELHARHAQRQLQDTMPAPDEDTPVEPPGDGGIGDPRRFVTERVLGQLAELPELQVARSRSTIDELQKIKDTINRLELSGGPANVTAFHDFHTLQLAFEDVWTAAFDDGLRDQVLDLYRQTVALHEDYGLEVPPMDDIGDANALREYLAILRHETADAAAILPIPGNVQTCFPQLDLVTWNRLDDDGRQLLRSTALNHLHPWDVNDIDPNLDLWSSQEYLDEQYAKAIKYHQNTPLARIDRLIVDVAERLNQPYAFKYFAPGSINYGLLVTYRQEWMPETYQVGRLVSTIPLAPGEERKLKVTRKVNKTRAEKAIEKALMESSSERQFTSRSELEVMSKVVSSTNFRMTASGSLSMGIGQISSTSEFALNQQQEATQQKKQFLEAIQKSAERVRQETEIQVDTNEQAEDGIESDTVLKNPNNELTVTYLLYELERRYRVTSRPHRLTPVVLVAMDIPAPHEITEGWILEHAWILRRMLLDDGFELAISYIESGLSGDDLDIEVRKANWDTQRDTLAQLESDFERMVEIRNTRQDTIVGLLQNENLAHASEMDDGQRAAAAIFSGGLSELFGGGTTDRDELFKARREAAEKALEYIAARVEALSERVSLARKAVSEAADAYSAAIQRKTRKDTAIRQLKLHLRQNILHYMHSIWDYKHQDQQFFELNDLEVPFLEAATRRCRLRRATADEVERSVPGIVRDGALYIVTCDAPLAPPVDTPLPRRRLGSIADLNRPLGYKGNYVIYPLKRCSYLTDYMSQEFVDDYFGLRDPSTSLGYTGEELLAYASEVLSDSSAALSASERAALISAVTEQLSNPAQGSETVILPTGQLYMEALKGEQTLLEDFKLAHRGMDVLKVQEEVRTQRLDNLRRAARIVADVPNLEDPDVEKTVVVHGPGEVRFPLTPDA